MRWRGLIFVTGVALAAIVGLFIRGDVVPWAVGGLGVAAGLLNVQEDEVSRFLLAGAALTVALMSIQGQPYNPQWLTSVVLYEKVFVTHAVLAVAFVSFARIARD